MKTNDRVSQMLKEWRIDVPPSPDFRPGVWSRIGEEKQKIALSRAVRSRLGTIGAACLVTLAVSGWTGHAYARAKVQSDREALATSYLSSLDARVQSTISR